MSGYKHMPEATRYKILELYAQGLTMDAVAERVGYSATTVWEKITQAGVTRPNKPRKRGPHKLRGTKARKYWEPSPEELRQRCLEVQETWSDLERSRREVVGAVPVSVQRVKVGELVGAVRMTERERDEL